MDSSVAGGGRGPFAACAPDRFLVVNARLEALLDCVDPFGLEPVARAGLHIQVKRLLRAEKEARRGNGLEDDMVPPRLDQNSRVLAGETGLAVDRDDHGVESIQ